MFKSFESKMFFDFRKQATIKYSEMFLIIIIFCDYAAIFFNEIHQYCHNLHLKKFLESKQNYGNLSYKTVNEYQHCLVF